MSVLSKNGGEKRKLLMEISWLLPSPHFPSLLPDSLLFLMGTCGPREADFTPSPRAGCCSLFHLSGYRDWFKSGQATYAASIGDSQVFWECRDKPFEWGMLDPKQGSWELVAANLVPWLDAERLSGDTGRNRALAGTHVSVTGARNSFIVQAHLGLRLFPSVNENDL